LVINP